MFKDRKVKKAPSKGVNTILLKDSQVEEKKQKKKQMHVYGNVNVFVGDCDHNK